MSLDRRCGHICPISEIPRVRRDEEGVERCASGGQTLVIPNEEATRKGCIQHVEGSSDVRLINERHTDNYAPCGGNERTGEEQSGYDVVKIEL
jgi:hypothetical protein